MLVTAENSKTDSSIKIIRQSLKQIQFQIKKIEKCMSELIKSENTILQNYKLCTSVQGVGNVLAIQMLLHTHNFSRFEDWRQFSAYCGIVPYPHQSGTSINGRRKIHSISDRK